MENVVKKKKIKWDQASFVAFTTSIPLLMFCVFYVYVNYSSIRMAFVDEYTNQGTWKYFELFFKEMGKADGDLIISLKNTLRYFVLQNFILFPLSVLFSYFLYKKIYGYKWFRIIFFMPSIISGVVLSTIFRYMVNGPISDMVQEWFNMEYPPLFFNSPKYANSTIMVYVFWLGLAGQMIIFSGTMARIPHEIVESSKIDGAGFFREFVSICIPLIWPTLSTLILMNVIGIFGASGPVILFTRGQYGTSTLSYWIYEATAVAPNYHYASAVGLVMTAVTIPIVFICRWVMNKINSGVEY